MFKAFLDRRRSKKIAQTILESAREIPEDTPARYARTIEVAFISIPTPDAATYAERSAIVLDIAHQNEGQASSIVPIMIVIFGTTHTATLGASIKFVEHVQSRLPGMTSIVHGTIAASVGSFGNGEYQTFGFWWPHTVGALHQLATLAPGKSVALPFEQSA